MDNESDTPLNTNGETVHPPDTAREESFREPLDFGGEEDVEEAADDRHEEIIDEPDAIEEPLSHEEGAIPPVTRDPVAGALEQPAAGANLPDVEAEIPRRMEPTRWKPAHRGGRPT